MLAALTFLAAGGLPPHTPPISDLAGVLDAGQEAELVSIIDEAAADGTVVLEVLTVERMSDWEAGNGTIESFAQDVFDTWGIGDASTNDGALIVVAVGDREARIELGLGFGGRYDGAMTTVMQEVMLPRFRDGDFGGGIVEGARRAVARLNGPVDVGAGSEPLVSGASGSTGDEGGGVPWLPIGVGAATLAGAGGAMTWSRRPRKCPTCGTPCTLVGEADDDVLLDDGQRCEEYLNSVDHRAWKCPSCNHVELTHHPRIFTRTKRCDACGYRTARSERRTVSKATYSSTGTAVVTTSCQHRGCGHVSERHITLPRLRESSSSGFSSGGGGSSSGRSSGGSSGGGGASGKW